MHCPHSRRRRSPPLPAPSFQARPLRSGLRERSFSGTASARESSPGRLQANGGRSARPLPGDRSAPPPEGQSDSPPCFSAGATRGKSGERCGWPTHAWSGFPRNDGNHQLVIFVTVVEESGGGEILDDDPLQEGRRGQHVAVAFDLDAFGENGPEKAVDRGRREPPVVSPSVHIVTADLTDASNRRKQYAAGLQQMMSPLHRLLDIKDDVERLSAD